MRLAFDELRLGDLDFLRPSDQHQVGPGLRHPGSAKGHEEPFRMLRLGGRCEFRKRSFAADGWAT
jgi:hypothetical protein